MKHNTLLLLIAMLLCPAMSLSAAQLPCDTVAGDLSNTRIYTLRNGLKVYLSVNKEKPRIQTYIAVRTGSKNDPSETTGLAHYLEHLMFKGTRQFGVTDPMAEQPLLDQIEHLYEQYRLLTDTTARRQKYHEIDSLSQVAAQYFIPNEYDKLMATIGSEGSNAYTSTDVTCYVEDIPANQVEAWARIQADRMQNMVIRGFHTELEAVYEEYNIHLTNDMEKMFNAMYTKLFPNHPYGTQTTIGTQQHLKNPSITNIKRYYDRWYRPNNVAICMAGDMDPDAVVATIDKYFGQWQPGSDVRQPVFPALPSLSLPVDTTVMGQEAERLMLAWRYGKASSLEADTMEVLQQMLYNGTAGLIDLDVNSKMAMLQGAAFTDAMQDHSALFLFGMPKEGQTLDDVRRLLIEQVDRLKNGQYSDDLLPSVINNMKLRYYTGLESNSWRANEQVQAFINGTPWQQQSSLLSRLNGITREQMTSFARRHLTDGYVCVYKKLGEDLTQKPVEKPAITPIPTNRHLQSDFIGTIQQMKVEHIQPQFVHFDTDIKHGETKRHLPMSAVIDPRSGRFQMSFLYDFGNEADLRYDIAADYLDYIGTATMSPQEIKQRFYRLACNMQISVGQRQMSVNLSGLAENMPEALRLTEQVLAGAKADDDTWRQYVDILEKARMDNKKEQRTCFSALFAYGQYGRMNPWRNIISTAELRQTDPSTLTALLRGLSQMRHEVLYYGPLDIKQLSKTLSRHHKTPRHLIDVPQNRHHQQLATPKDEVWIAPYDAKNIYMRMLHQEMRPWHEDEVGVQALYNEYFGGGMNTVVFQELREARGLAYNAWASYLSPSYKDQPELFMTHIITQNDKMMDCINQFHHIIDTLPQNPAAFLVAKDAMTKRLESQRTMRWGILSKWLDARDLGINYDVDERIYQQLPTLTMQDMVRFAEAQTARKPYRYIILGDEKQLDIPALEKIGAIKRLTLEEIFGY